MVTQKCKSKVRQLLDIHMFESQSQRRTKQRCRPGRLSEMPPSVIYITVLLSPCAVDSLNPSNRHSQHPPRTQIPHYFSQLLQAHPRSHQYLLHPPFPRSSPPPPPLSTCQHHLLLQTSHPHHMPDHHHKRLLSKPF